MSASVVDRPRAEGTEHRPALPGLALGALGVVFGDLGTSPLYAVQQVLTDAPGIGHDPTGALGVPSLILWSIVLVVCVKYATFVLRADHEGEGGTMALLGLLRAHGAARGTLGPLVLVVLFGSALLYGDGIVTPAISVLSAVEGLHQATTTFDAYIVPISAAILTGLFLVQSRGTGSVGVVFGPVLLLWFATIGVLGGVAVAAHPDVLAAFDPRHAAWFLIDHGWRGYALLGAVVLCVSGVEALFADLGHFGRRPILLAWYLVVLPALVLNYLGQATVIDADTPFWALVPRWGVYPMVALSTAATVIASQALISGAFSLTRQAVNMGFAPRLAVVHTSREQSGQVYMPVVNFALMVGSVALILIFRSSAALGAAYGLAVTGTMTTTTIAFHAVLRRVWGWGAVPAAALMLLFLSFDLAFFGASLTKLLAGAWVPLAVALCVMAIFVTWTGGHARFQRSLRDWAMPIARFEAEMQGWEARTEGTAVFLTQHLDEVPLIGRHDWLRRHVRQERILLLSVESSRVPYVPPERRLSVEERCLGVWAGRIECGFMQNPDIEATLAAADEAAIKEGREGMVFYLARPFPTRRNSWFGRLRQSAYLLMARSAQTPVEYFALPPGQTVSVGLELEV